MTPQDEISVEECVQHSKRDCNKHVNGVCQLRRCLIAGGWRLGDKVDYSISTCHANATIAHLRRLQEVEAAIKAHDPSRAPCGCCEQGKYGEGIWSYSCDCQNYGDCAEAAAWCREKNSYQKLLSAISAGEGKDEML